MDQPPRPTASELFEQLYGELHLLARRYMGGERPDHTLQPTALIHEAFLRLQETSPSAVANRVHFLRLAARAMRHVLVDHARKKGAVRHGGLMTRVTLTDDIRATPAVVDLIAFSEAIGRLEQLSERQATIIDMRFIGGLTVEEVAEALGISEKTVKNETRVALAWLRRELELD